jgi:hypothetical protein
MSRLAVLLAALVALVGVTAGSCDTAPEQFTRDCKARGGIVHSHKQGNSTSFTCDPPPAPSPLGWQ